MKNSSNSNHINNKFLRYTDLPTKTFFQIFLLNFPTKMYLDKRIGWGCYIPLRAGLKRVVVKCTVFFRETVGNS